MKALLPILALAGAAVGQVPPPTPFQPGADVVVNMHDVDIAAVADQISRITGRTLILDPQVRGQVTVTSAEPLSNEAVWDLFQSVLRVHGFAAVRSGRVWRVVPQANAVRDVGGGYPGAQVTTRLIRLHNVAPETAARIFRPIVAQFGSVEPLTNPNAIVVTDYADNIRRIEALARALDGSGGTAFETITLARASAKEVGQAIQSLFGTAESAPKVAVDERSNVVLVRGDPRSVGEAKHMAERMDRPGGATPITRVIRLKNADAESVTDVLRGLLGGQDQSPNPIARTLANANPTIGAGAIGTSITNTPSTLATNPVTGATTTATTTSSTTLPLSSSSPQSTGFSTPDLAVQSAPELNAIVVRATPANLAQIQSMVEQLDVRRPQVMIEAAIVEITGDKAEALGVQFGLGKNLPGVTGATSSFTNIDVGIRDVLAALNVPLAAVASSSGFTGAISSGDSFQLLVQALGTSSKANLLSTPSITTLDNQPAQIVVGQNVPFRTGSYTTLAGGTTAPFTTIERQDVGLTLRIIPRIHDGEVVRLDVSQEVSSLTDPVSGAADLITNRRSIQTTVLADNAQTIVLGGLISDDRINSKSQVPVLGDIPIIGNAFKSRKLSQTKRTLFVFLRPTILRTAEQAAVATAGKYARLRSAEADLSDNSSLLLDPPKARLTVEIWGVY
ncbi:type II secretion system secretin GspD [Sphingomonas sp. MMS24-J13]|uniref:type II secretion system secretin GspD n=1 Tax=Sphingomonas sp. MMS24-J13 TaxID=3238686 RepID=UPI0038507ABC